MIFKTGRYQLSTEHKRMRYSEEKRPFSPRDHTLFRGHRTLFILQVISIKQRHQMKIGGGVNMPRMSKKDKQEWAFFLNDKGRITYAEQCRKCERDCKQSFRATILLCPEYSSKRRKRG